MERRCYTQGIYMNSLVQDRPGVTCMLLCCNKILLVHLHTCLFSLRGLQHVLLIACVCNSLRSHFLPLKFSASHKISQA